MASEKALDLVYRDCPIAIYKQWNKYDFDGVYYSYEVSVENQVETNESDEFWICLEEEAVLQAKEYIDYLLDKEWLISCLCTRDTTCVHFPLAFYGAKAEAEAFAKKVASDKYPNWDCQIVVELLVAWNKNDEDILD